MARRCSDDIDPKREDVARKRRRTRHRAKPDPSPAIAAEKPKALSRALKRPLSPGIMYEREGDHYLAAAPHSDRDAWELALADAFATRSRSVIRTFVEDLRKLCSTAWDGEGWKPSEIEMSAGLAFISDLQPRTVAEAALAAQMLVTHWLTLRLGAQALNGGGMVLDQDAALTGKLARTFAMQLETYQGLRGKRRTARQSIKISRESHHHQHIHVHRDDQSTPAGRVLVNQDQSHGPTAHAINECSPLRRNQSLGSVVPLPRRTGKE